MVKVCYLIPIACLLNAMSYGLLIAKNSNYRNQLSAENRNKFGGSQYTFIRPNLSKRELGVENNDKRSSNDFINETNDENSISYCSRITNTKSNHSTKKFHTSVKDSVSDWNDEYYNTAGRKSAHRPDSQELKKIIDHYLGMGKEKWAGFLATSSSGHFRHIIKKLKKIIGKRKDNIDEDDEEEGSYNHETDFEPDSKNKKIEKPDDEDEGEDRDTFKNNTENSNQYSYELKYSKNGNTYYASKQVLFNNITKKDIAKLKSMFSDVSKYWESKDAKDIIESANYVTYKDFKVEGEEKVFGCDFPLEKESQIQKDEILESLDPDEIKTDEQKKWLKYNALRRANLIQQLLNGEIDDEDIYKSDDFQIKDGIIFPNEDNNEFENMSPGFKMQSTNLALYIAFMATEIAFIIGF